MRRNAAGLGGRVIVARPVQQPALPPIYETNPSTGKKRRVAWPAETRNWWQMWGDSPLSDDFTSTDWSEMLVTARLHAAVVNGELKYANELRLRVAKFGATPEDRARLRITFAAADEADERRAAPSSSARSRRGPLKAV